MIPVTKSFLPPIEEYMTQVQRAYDNNWLTNLDFQIYIFYAKNYKLQH